jgi:hypothetical protein
MGRRTPTGLLVQTLGFIFANYGKPHWKPDLRNGRIRNLAQPSRSNGERRCNEESGSFDPALVHGVAQLALPLLWPTAYYLNRWESPKWKYSPPSMRNGVKYAKKLSTSSATRLDRACDGETNSRLDNSYPRWADSNPYTHVSLENGLVQTTYWVRTSLQQEWCTD